MQDVTPRVSSTTIETVLRVLHSQGPLTRNALVARAGLSRPSVSAAVAALLTRGIVEEVLASPSGRGRPSRAVRLSTRRADAVGIEIGRRHVAVAVTDATGAIVTANAHDVDPFTTLEQRASLALQALDDVCGGQDIRVDSVRRVVVGTPGPRFVIPGKGALDFNLTRLERERSAVEAIVSQRFGLPVEIGNNTRYTAVAEAHRRDPNIDLVYLRVDQGVGGGIVQRGEPVAGALGAAGEMGHVSIDPFGDRCPCGGRGCLELVAGLPAVVQAAGARDMEDLRNRATEPKPVKAIHAAATATGGMLAGVLAIANPSVIVVGGSVAALPGFLSQLESVTRDAAPTWATLDLAIEVADTDHLMGAIGAATAGSKALRDVLTLHNSSEEDRVDLPVTLQSGDARQRKDA